MTCSPAFDAQVLILFKKQKHLNFVHTHDLV